MADAAIGAAFVESQAGELLATDGGLGRSGLPGVGDWNLARCRTEQRSWKNALKNVVRRRLVLLRLGFGAQAVQVLDLEDLAHGVAIAGGCGQAGGAVDGGGDDAGR